MSDQYLKHAKDIVEKVFDKQSLHQAGILIMQGDFFNEIGDFKKAEEAFAKADEIFLSKLGKENLKRSETLSKLAAIKYKRGTKIVEVEKLYQEAGKIIQKSVGENNPLYSLHLQKLAEFYIQIKRTEEADRLLGEAEKYWDKKIGSDNKYNAEIKLLQGDLAYNKDKFDVAEKNYQKSRQLFSSIFNEKHPGYIQATGKLARLQYMVKGYDKSLELMEEIIPKYLDYTRNYFPSLSFREKSKFWSKMKDEFEFYNFLALEVFGNKKSRLSSEVYNNTIATKALLLSSNIKLREQILISKDTVLIGMYNEWIMQSESLTSSLSYTKEQLTAQNLDPHHIEASIEHLEKEMSKRSALFNGEEIKKRATWKEIRTSLKENEYAVEMVRYRFFNKVFTDSVIYKALIVNKQSNESPDVVAFSNGNAMEKKFLKYYRNVANMNIRDEYSYDTYWKNIKSEIPDGATVYFSSEGVYNQLNLEMMPAADGSFVLEKNQIVLVTNTKDLLGVTENKKKSNSKDVRKTHTDEYLLCGNPDFYSEKNNIKNTMVVALPGAENEVNELTALLSGTGKRTVKVLSNHVTEDTIASFVNPKVFHIATHGYFKETAIRGNDDDFASNPLLNSGLMLSGAGEILSNAENTYVNQKDGILTAYEAMNLNFVSTELVVLSACETGRGDVQVGEGVYGLQRSFLIAGADAVIMSLFKVNDEITQKLMLSFYKKWIESGNKRKAFLEAKREIRKAYDNPLSWGAFIMIEGRPYREQTLQALVKE
ncbi:MAG: CHAT domain-containing protein [Sporocytophaga sp.]|nr:CHAT domain-containing protein [Sporocytophaga sp.]